MSERDGAVEAAKRAAWDALAQLRYECPDEPRQIDSEALDLIVRAAIAAYERAAWQPIETAPKDGTHILIARQGEDVGMGTIEITEWFVTEWVRYEPEGDLYRQIKDEIGQWNGNGHRATHWRPLPEPPDQNLPLKEAP